MIGDPHVHRFEQMPPAGEWVNTHILLNGELPPANRSWSESQLLKRLITFVEKNVVAIIAPLVSLPFGSIA